MSANISAAVQPQHTFELELEGLLRDGDDLITQIRGKTAFNEDLGQKKALSEIKQVGDSLEEIEGAGEVLIKQVDEQSAHLANINHLLADLDKQVTSVMDEMESLIDRSIRKRGVGEFTVPGLMKITTVKKPARKARKGINPFNGEETTFKAKPASIAVKVRPLKKMKEFAN